MQTDNTTKGRLLPGSKPRSVENRDYTLAAIIWGLGAWGLFALRDWSLTLEPDWRDTVEFVTYGVAGIYILAFPLLKWWVSVFFDRTEGP